MLTLFSHRAFSFPAHHSNLDHLFSLMFDLVLGHPDEATPIPLSSSLPGLSAAPCLKIPADVRVSVELC